MKFYLVGGAIRDMLLGTPPKEYDFSFSGTVDDFISRNPSARKAGNDFGICIHHGIEYAPLRGDSIEEDLTRRDLTINALALDSEGRLYSLPTTLSDIQKKIIRPASRTAFMDDPLRVFRVARFAAAFPDFSVHSQTITQLKEVARSGCLNGLTPERVGTELLKALATVNPGRFLEVLEAGNCLAPWFNELSLMPSIPAGPIQYHSEDCFAHTVNTVNSCSSDVTARYMALCHDLGKQLTEKEMLPRHIGHEKRGEEQAKVLGERLKLSNNLIRAGMVAAREHMKGGMYDTLRAGTRVDLLYPLHKMRLLESFFDMIRADSGNDFLPAATADLQVILSVTLPEEYQNLGAESGNRLRELRCLALAEANKKAPKN